MIQLIKNVLKMAFCHHNYNMTIYEGSRRIMIMECKKCPDTKVIRMD